MNESNFTKIRNIVQIKAADMSVRRRANKKFFSVPQEIGVFHSPPHM